MDRRHTYLNSRVGLQVITAHTNKMNEFTSHISFHTRHWRLHSQEGGWLCSSTGHRRPEIVPNTLRPPWLYLQAFLAWRAKHDRIQRWFSLSVCFVCRTTGRILKKFGMKLIPLEPILVILIHLELIIWVIWRTNELVSAGDICETYKCLLRLFFRNMRIKDRQCKCNVVLRGLRVNKVAAKKKCYIF